MLSTALDLLAVACLAVFAWFVWPPLPLAVVGFAALAVSRKREQSDVSRKAAP